MPSAASEPEMQAARRAALGLDPALTAISENLWRFNEEELEVPEGSLVIQPEGNLVGSGDPIVEFETSAELVMPMNTKLCRLVEVASEPKIQSSLDGALEASAEEPVAETALESEFLKSFKERTKN